MEKLDIRGLKEKARDTLENTTPDYRRLVVLHSAISMGVLFFVTLVGFIIGRLDSNTGGLASMGTGALLNTAQSFFDSVTSFLMPFWQAGILFTSLQVARRQRADFPMLTQGFHRLGALLRYEILLLGVMLAVVMVSAYASLAYVMIVPLPETLMSAMEWISVPDTQDPYAIFNQLPVEFWDYLLIPSLLISAIVMVITLHLSYRFRLCQYAILDGEQVGARMSIGISNRLTKGFKWDLFKLDLSFWWYYGAQLLLSIVVYIPMILDMGGVSLPLSGDMLNLICYLVYCGLTVVLAYLAGAYVETTNALAYEDLCSRQQEIAVIPEMEIR